MTDGQFVLWKGINRADMNVYFMFLEGEPLPENKESKEFAGAYINCWVNAKDNKSAKDKAMKCVHEEGWKILKIKAMFVTNRKRYLENPESLECFDQALTYGIGIVFYTWPADGKMK